MLTLRDLIRGNHSLDSAYAMYARGYTSRKAWRRFATLWSWSAYRYEGEAHEAQQRLIARWGEEGLARRIARARRLGDAIAR